MTPDPNQLHFIPGDHPADYRYLFEGHSELLTDLERRAWRRIFMSREMAATDSPVQRGMMTRHWMEVEESVTRMLQQGEQRFFAATFERVLREEPQRLRTCPRCGSLCRTSKACLCPHCSHTWFEAREICLVT